MKSGQSRAVTIGWWTVQLCQSLTRGARERESSDVRQLDQGAAPQCVMHGAVGRLLLRQGKGGGVGRRPGQVRPHADGDAIRRGHLVRHRQHDGEQARYVHSGPLSQGQWDIYTGPAITRPTACSGLPPPSPSDPAHAKPSTVSTSRLAEAAAKPVPPRLLSWDGIPG